MRMAVVDGTTVVNIIEAEPDFTLPGKTLVDAGDAGIGWTWDGSTFSPPEPPTLAFPPLTARQLRLGLVASGISLAAVEAAIDAIEDAADRELARIEWEYASQFERDHPLIEQVGAAVGLSIQQINDAWLEAVGL